MGRKYSVTWSSAVTAQQDFFEILAATGKPVILHQVELEQSTEVGDAMEEGLVIRMVRGVGTVTSGSGGTAGTSHQLDNGDANSSATVEINNTTKMVVGTGTLEPLANWAWNVRVPFCKIFTPELRPIVTPGDRLTIELATTPGDTTTISANIYYEEIG